MYHDTNKNASIQFILFIMLQIFFDLSCLLPPAYVVRREGTVFTGVCLSTGGEGGYLTRYPPGGGSGYPPGGYLTGYPPGGGPGTPPGGGGVPDRVPPGGSGYPPGGGTQLGQHREYLLHSGRYASCIHAGGLSSFFLFWYVFIVNLLPPAYVVRWEGNSFTLFVCPHLGGVRSSRGGGGQVSEPTRGGVRSVSWRGGGVRSVSRQGGGSGQWADKGGSGPASGRGGQVQLVGGGQVQPAGGGQIQPVGGGQSAGGGQHLAPSCGRYASCVHAGGLLVYAGVLLYNKLNCRSHDRVVRTNEIDNVLFT